MKIGHARILLLQLFHNLIEPLLAPRWKCNKVKVLFHLYIQPSNTNTTDPPPPPPPACRTPSPM